MLSMITVGYANSVVKSPLHRYLDISTRIDNVTDQLNLYKLLLNFILCVNPAQNNQKYFELCNAINKYVTSKVKKSLLITVDIFTNPYFRFVIVLNIYILYILLIHTKQWLKGVFYTLYVLTIFIYLQRHFDDALCTPS